MTRASWESVAGIFLVAAASAVALVAMIVLFPQSQQTNRITSCVKAGGSYVATDSDMRCDR